MKSLLTGSPSLPADTTTSGRANQIPEAMLRRALDRYGENHNVICMEDIAASRTHIWHRAEYEDLIAELVELRQKTTSSLTLRSLNQHLSRTLGPKLGVSCHSIFSKLSAAPKLQNSARIEDCIAHFQTLISQCGQRCDVPYDLSGYNEGSAIPWLKEETELIKDTIALYVCSPHTFASQKRRAWASLVNQGFFVLYKQKWPQGFVSDMTRVEQSTENHIRNSMTDRQMNDLKQRLEAYRKTENTVSFKSGTLKEQALLSVIRGLGRRSDQCK